MPDKRRLRRLGTTTAAISVSAAALMIGGAGPADAAAAKCPVGHDPASTLKSIQCNLNEAGKAFQQQVDKWGHPQQQPQSPPPSAPAGKPDNKPQPAAGTSSAANAPLVPPGAAAPASTGLQPAGADQTPQQPQLPILTADQLPLVAGGSATAPQTHLISPAAAASDDQSPFSAPIVAAVSAVAGAAIALNLSYAARRLRRRAG